MIRLFAAALGLLVVTIWAVAVSYGAPAWLSWGNFTLALVVVGSLGTLRDRNEAAVATWPLAGMVLLALWLFGLRQGGTSFTARVSHGLAWVDLVAAAGFLALTAAAFTETTELRHRQGFWARWWPARPRREVYRT